MTLPPPSQPPSTALPLPDPEAYPGEPREYARALMQRKDDIEREIAVLNDVLSSHGANAATSLFDPEGFPRADIDIYSIRHTRSALARLTTDRNTVNNLLVPALEAAFSAGPSNGPIPVKTQESWPSQPVARVNTVAESSPAAAAGLKIGDEIYSFGDVTSGSGIQAIGALVARSEGTSINLKILRAGQKVTMSITPRNGWGGRGSLGCHILPV